MMAKSAPAICNFRICQRCGGEWPIPGRPLHQPDRWLRLLEMANRRSRRTDRTVSGGRRVGGRRAQWFGICFAEPLSSSADVAQTEGIEWVQSARDPAGPVESMSCRDHKSVASLTQATNIGSQSVGRFAEGSRPPVQGARSLPRRLCCHAVELGCSRFRPEQDFR